MVDAWRRWRRRLWGSPWEESSLVLEGKNKSLASINILMQVFWLIISFCRDLEN